MQPIKRLNDMSAYSSEFDVLAAFQRQYDERVQSLESLSLNSISELMDEIELKMNDIDAIRAPQDKIFVDSLRAEWLDNLVKKYVLSGGEVGVDLSPEELNSLQIKQSNYLFPFERMRAQFNKNKSKLAEVKDYSDFLQFISMQKEAFQKNLLLTVNNLKTYHLPVVVVFKFKYLQDLKYETVGHRRVKRSKAMFQKELSEYLDSFSQLCHILSTQQLDYLKLEGNLSCSDFVKKKHMQASLHHELLQNISQGARIRFLDLSNVSATSLKKGMFSSMKLIPNDNMKVLSEILTAVTNSDETRNCLQSISLCGVDFDCQVAGPLCKLFTRVEEVYLNGCQLGQKQDVLDQISSAFNQSSSLRSIELNQNELKDSQAETLLLGLLQAIGDKNMRLQKLCIARNSLGTISSTILNQIMMKSQMRIVDIRSNSIVLRHLDTLIVTAGYKFNLEFFGIEENKQFYEEGHHRVSCFSASKPARECTEVSMVQVANRNQRVQNNYNVKKFVTARRNVEKLRGQRMKQLVEMQKPSEIQNQQQYPDVEERPVEPVQPMYNYEFYDGGQGNKNAILLAVDEAQHYEQPVQIVDPQSFQKVSS